MTTPAIRLPDDERERLEVVPESNSTSANRLADGLATVTLANRDARVRHEVRAPRAAA